MLKNMEKISFYSNRKARIPFALLGIFLLIASSITGTIIINLEKKQSENVYVVMSSSHIEKMIAMMQNDLSSCLNYAGMDAMDYAGKYPVTKPNVRSKMALRYNEGSWKNYRDGWDFDEMKRFNLNWIRDMTRRKLNMYIEDNYKGNVFNDGRYAINADYVNDWREIGVREIYMEIESDSFSSIESIFGYRENRIPAYILFYVPVKIEIKDMEKDRIVGMKILNISSIITSRYPLMMELVHRFEECINSTDLLKNKLFLLFTALSQIYTEGRALAQYGGMYEKVPNIVDNRWIRYVVNGAILFEEFMIFRSIDPMASIYLLLNSKELASSGFPEQDEAENIFENSNYTSEVSEVFTDVEKDVRGTISDGLNKIWEGTEMKFNISRMAEDILYEGEYSYYYYNYTHNLTWISDQFYGYEIERNGMKYHMIPPPPYHYFNRTYYEMYGENISRDYYVRNLTYSNYNFHIILDSRNIYQKKPGKRLRKEVIDRIKEEIDHAYKCIFHVRAKWNVSKISANDTFKIRNISKFVKDGDIINSFPYNETWEVKWGEENSSFKINYEFEIGADYSRDVENPFEEVLINLSEIRRDINLVNISRDFVSSFVSWRDSIMEELRRENGTYEYQIEIPSGENFYAPGWIFYEVEKALRNVIDEIGEEINMSVGEDFMNKNASDSIDYIVEKLTEIYREREGHIGHINEKYGSCAIRVIERMKEWYVKEVEKAINMSKTGKDFVMENIENGFHGYISRKKQAMIVNGYDIKKLPPIQFGLNLKIKNHQWSENVGFSIDQKPDYFIPSKPDDSYRFMEKNICIFGPSGLPVLPTPITPWLITINAWYIEIQGQFEKFEIADTTGEMKPDIIFGGTNQIYRIARNYCQDPFTDEVIGETVPLSFVIKSGSVAVTPPGFIGDLNPESYTVEANGEGIGIMKR